MVLETAVAEKIPLKAEGLTPLTRTGWPTCRANGGGRIGRYNRAGRRSTGKTGDLICRLASQVHDGERALPPGVAKAQFSLGETAICGCGPLLRLTTFIRMHAPAQAGDDTRRWEHLIHIQNSSGIRSASSEDCRESDEGTSADRIYSYGLWSQGKRIAVYGGCRKVSRGKRQQAGGDAVCAIEVYDREGGVPAVGNEGEVANVIDSDGHRSGSSDAQLGKSFPYGQSSSDGPSADKTRLWRGD